MRQCVSFSPGMLILIDNSEENLFQIDIEINSAKQNINIMSIHGSILEKCTLSQSTKKWSLCKLLGMMVTT